MLVSVKDACTLQDNALDVRVADQIEQLDELIRLEGHGEAFFAKTHDVAREGTMTSPRRARSAWSWRPMRRVRD